MTWACFLGDTRTGLLAQQVDVPAFSWSMTVSDSTFTTTRDRRVDEAEGSGVELPWGAVHAENQPDRCEAVMPLKRCLTLMWVGEDGTLTPLVWGAIGPRTDKWDCTSFNLLSAMSLLESRFAVREGAFGAVRGMTEVEERDEWERRDDGYSEGATVSHGGRVWRSEKDGNRDEPGKSDSWTDMGPVETTQAGTFTREAITYGRMSLRGIAASVGELCTSAKPGGELPIDWTYAGEPGSESRTYDGFDVGNNSCADIIGSITATTDGPDVQFRPYMADSRHVRLRFTAASDADVYIGQSAVHTLSCFPGGGSLQDVEVDFGYPVMRLYATGAGTDEAQLCHLSQNLSLCQTYDPWPLVEEHYSDPDADSGAILASDSDAELEAGRMPAMQIRGYVDFADPDVPDPGTLWPGETVEVALWGFPTVPDGVYETRLMSMSGDQSTRARLEFRAIPNPVA